MTTENIISGIAIADLAPYRFGKITSTGIGFGTSTVSDDSISIDADGVIINSRAIYTAGMYVDLKVNGVQKVEIKEGESIAPGDYVIPSTDGSGKAVKARLRQGSKWHLLRGITALLF